MLLTFFQSVKLERYTSLELTTEHKKHKKSKSMGYQGCEGEIVGLKSGFLFVVHLFDVILPHLYDIGKGNSLNMFISSSI